MRLISRHRHHHRQAKVPRIRISEAEIAADLHYPAARRAGAGAARHAAFGGRR